MPKGPGKYLPDAGSEVSAADVRARDRIRNGFQPEYGAVTSDQPPKARLLKRCHHYDNGMFSANCQYCVMSNRNLNRRRA